MENQDEMAGPGGLGFIDGSQSMGIMVRVKALEAVLRMGTFAGAERLVSEAKVIEAYLSGKD